MQTKQTRQKAQENRRRKLNNGFIDLRHVDFIRKAECIKMGCDIWNRQGAKLGHRAPRTKGMMNLYVVIGLGGRRKKNSFPPQLPLPMLDSFKPSKVHLHELKWQIPGPLSLTQHLPLPKNPRARNQRFPGKSTHADMEINNVEIKAMRVRCSNGPNSERWLNLKVIK